MEASPADALGENWKPLHKAAGVSACAVCVIIPLQIAVFAIWKLPVDIEGWFALYRASWLLGLVHQDLLYIVNNVLVAVMYLAFYILLKPRHEGPMALAVLLGFLGISAYLGSNKSFEMLNLSALYYAAGSQAQQASALAAGQAMLAGWQGTAFDIYYILNGIALVMIASVMRKSTVFSGRTAGAGLVSGVLMMIPSTAGTPGLVFSLLSLIPWYVFSVLVARQFFRLSRPGGN